jgi:hypothetical protein
MSALGRLAYTIRSNYGHGLPTAYYRDIVRTRILHTPAITIAPSCECEIHVLTSSGDWLNLLWALKTFYHFSSRAYALCIHDDGTLSAKASFELRRHFPRARLISRSEADAMVSADLRTFPSCAELRRTNTLSLKLFDFRHYLRGDRMLLLDSDILFFAEPQELLRRIEDSTYLHNTVNEDLANAYTVDPNAVQERFGFELHPRFNSGLGLINGSSLNLEWIEQFLEMPGICGHFWRIEQTLFAMCSSKYGVELLPEEYRVRLETNAWGLPCRHYIGQIRHLMYAEGIRALTRDGFLREIALIRDQGKVRYGV